MVTQVEASECLQLNISGSAEVKHVYLCNEHADEYIHELGPWVTRTRPCYSLHMPCARCTELNERGIKVRKVNKE